MRDGKYPTGVERTNIIEAIAALERRIATLENGLRAGYTAVDGGIFEIKQGQLRVTGLSTEGTEQTVVHFGPVFAVGAPVPTPGWVLFRQTGEFVFALYGLPEDQFWAMFDKSSNVIVTDHSVSGGIGLGRPFITLAKSTIASLSTPTQIVTSASFTKLWRLHGVMQQPTTYVEYLVQTGVGTTAEVRLVNGVTGSVMAGPFSIGANVFEIHFLCGVNSGSYASVIAADVEARRVAGAGNVAVEVTYGVGGDFVPGVG